MNKLEKAKEIIKANINRGEFGIFNSRNERLTPNDLKTNMWVWNESQGEYQRVRYICHNLLNDYHWCDGYGNVIEDDELWRYKKESVENE